MASSEPGPVYEFGDFCLEVGERRLLHHGQAVGLTTKVFETLRVLLERPGGLFTKDELMQRIWPDSVVEENNLNHNISVLRKTLGERSAGLQFIETVPRVGYRFVADVSQAGSVVVDRLPAPAAAPVRTPRQEIRFCTSSDGTRIAYATTGTGPPLLKAANWLGHLEFEWESPVWRHWIDAIARRHTLIRCDERGSGLSDWNVDDLSLDAWVRDLEAVVEAQHVDRCALLGISQGGAAAVAFAARHPERVSHLILCGAYTRGWRHRGDPREIEARTSLVNLTRLGWGQENPAFREIFTRRFIPDAGPAEMAWFSDLQRVSASPENAARLMEAFSILDVRPLLAEIRVPTIVFHAQHDGTIPFDEGRMLAAAIPGSRFVPLPSRNHLLLEHEPAWPIFLEQLGTFLNWPASAASDHSHRGLR